MPRTLVVTNDFPPRQGGIESFIASISDRLAADKIVVYTASMPGDRAFDETLPFPVIRDRMGTLLPTRRVRKAVVSTLRSHGCSRVLFGSSVPLGLLAPSLRKAGAERIIALTHGHEVWWSRIIGTRQALRRVGDAVDVLTYVSDWCRDQIATVLTPAGRARQNRLSPGVDPDRFFPGCGGDQVRAELGLGDAPVVLCAARLVPRKGQDMLIEAWPLVQKAIPDARLLLVGDGPHRKALERRIARLGLNHAVLFTGPVPWPDIPPYFDAADVFAMPSRTRFGGLEPEALGIVFLEAAACGKPVIVGDSGGAPDTVEHGETGYVVNPRSPEAIAARLVELLADRERARTMGEAGRRRALAHWQWDDVAALCRTYLECD